LFLATQDDLGSIHISEAKRKPSGGISGIEALSSSGPGARIGEERQWAKSHSLTAALREKGCA
jgi:hypothetical protein